MHFYRSIICYDGTAYFGWQKTHAGPSIQEMLGKALAHLDPTSPLPEAASRTDRGVHAEGQVVSIQMHNRAWDPRGLQNALNAHLPSDIRILDIQNTAADFHPTLHAKGKEYRYRICLGDVQNPVHRLYSWAFWHPIKMKKMEESSRRLLGTHDFSALANEPKENPLCTLEEIKIIPLEKNRLEIVITGDRFLYKMVRNIVGTLLYIGCGKLPENCIASILASKDRTQAGMTAPAHGLALSKVFYPK